MIEASFPVCTPCFLSKSDKEMPVGRTHEGVRLLTTGGTCQNDLRFLLCPSSEGLLRDLQFPTSAKKEKKPLNPLGSYSAWYPPPPKKKSGYYLNSKTMVTVLTAIFYIYLHAKQTVAPVKITVSFCHNVSSTSLKTMFTIINLTADMQAPVKFM